MVHLQTPTRLDTQCTRVCLQQLVFFREQAYFEFVGLVECFYLGFVVVGFKYFGLTCVSADPVVCTASGTLT